MHICGNSQLEYRLEIGSKSNEMLVKGKLYKTKCHQMNKGKMNIKDTYENANRRKAGARFQYQTEKKKKKRIQGLKHTG